MLSLLKQYIKDVIIAILQDICAKRKEFPMSQIKWCRDWSQINYINRWSPYKTHSLTNWQICFLWINFLFSCQVYSTPTNAHILVIEKTWSYNSVRRRSINRKSFISHVLCTSLNSRINNIRAGKRIHEDGH